MDMSHPRCTEKGATKKKWPAPVGVAWCGSVSYLPAWNAANRSSQSCLGKFLVPGSLCNNILGSKNHSFQARMAATSLSAASSTADSAVVKHWRTGPRANGRTNSSLQGKLELPMDLAGGRVLAACCVWQVGQEHSHVQLARWHHFLMGCPDGSGYGWHGRCCPRGRGCCCCCCVGRSDLGDGGWLLRCCVNYCYGGRAGLCPHSGRPHCRGVRCVRWVLRLVLMWLHSCLRHPEALAVEKPDLGGQAGVGERAHAPAAPETCCQPACLEVRDGACIPPQISPCPNGTMQSTKWRTPGCKGPAKQKPRQLSAMGMACPSRRRPASAFAWAGYRSQQSKPQAAAFVGRRRARRCHIRTASQPSRMTLAPCLFRQLRLLHVELLPCVEPTLP